MGLLFSPRGGSSQVARYLSQALARQGHPVTIASGSLGGDGERGNAAQFFAGLDTVLASYDDAAARAARGEDPMDAPVPMHPSYEDRPGVADRWFPRVSPAQGEHLVASWERVLGSSPAFLRSRVLHLHHLTPLHAAAARTLPDVPVVTHLHGTELKMLDAIARGDVPPELADTARWWADRMGEWARAAQATIVISPYQRDEAIELLGLTPSRVHWLPDGVDVARFAVREPARDVRRMRWRRWLVSDPQGWDEQTGRPGSIRYSAGEVEQAFFAPNGEPYPVLLYVGRYLGFKRVPLLVRAYARARERLSTPAPLVIWGGAPGEWEGEHPHTVVTREGVPGVFFTGWRGHDDLPLGLSLASCFVAPAVDEPFGLVYLEAMACGIPVIGTTTGGPPSFVNVVRDEPDGWLVAPDDVEALADAIVRAVERPDERRRRGANAARHVREGYSWNRLAGRCIALYDQVAEP
jgi:glycosyltransferase involved in cell wall biosynthesis